MHEPSLLEVLFRTLVNAPSPSIRRRAEAVATERKAAEAAEAERVTALLPLPLSDLESPVKADIDYFRGAVAERKPDEAERVAAGRVATDAAEIGEAGGRAAEAAVFIPAPAPTFTGTAPTTTRGPIQIGGPFTGVGRSRGTLFLSAAPLPPPPDAVVASTQTGKGQVTAAALPAAKSRCTFFMSK